MSSTAITHPTYEPSVRENASLRLLERAANETEPGEVARLHDAVVLTNTSLAAGLARRYDHRGIDHDDLAQVALMGLVEAVRRYRPGAGAGFTAFAVPTITGELKRHFRDCGWVIRPPRVLQELHRDVRWATAELLQSTRQTPTSDQIAARLGVSSRSVRLAQELDVQYRPLSLEGAWPGADDSATLKDVIPDPTDPFHLVEVVAVLKPLLAELDEPDRLLLRLRFVDRLTQQQIGERLAVSQMQVSRLLRDVLDRLRVRAVEGGT